MNSKTINQLIEENIDKHISVTLDPDDVSVAGQKDIKKFLKHVGYLSPDYTFDWRVKTDRGTLGKRIAAYNYNSAGYKIEPEVIESINNIADKHRAYRDAFFFTFDSGLFWRLGDFNDADSCYWQSKSYMRAKLNGSMRAYAIKIYEDAKFTRPFGRAIIFTNCPDEESVICINAYPKGFQVTNIGRLLVKFASMNEVKTVTGYLEVTYRGSWQDYLWINGGNGAIVCAYEENRTLPKSIDLLHDVGIVFEKCMKCGRETRDLYRLPNDIGSLCSSCYSKVVTCSFCGDVCFSGKWNKIPLVGYVCSKCYGSICHCTRCGTKKKVTRDMTEKVYTATLSFAASGDSNYLSFVPFYGLLCRRCAIFYQSETYYPTSNAWQEIVIKDNGMLSVHVNGIRSYYGDTQINVLKSLKEIKRYLNHGNETVT